MQEGKNVNFSRTLSTTRYVMSNKNWRAIWIGATRVFHYPTDLIMTYEI